MTILVSIDPPRQNRVWRLQVAELPATEQGLEGFQELLEVPREGMGALCPFTISHSLYVFIYSHPDNLRHSLLRFSPEFYCLFREMNLTQGTLIYTSGSEAQEKQMGHVVNI